jgi:hypothetical protein
MTARTTAKRRGVSLEALRQIALALPGVEEGTSYGTVAFKVRKKLLARLREDGVTLAVKSAWDERANLMEADPKTFFITDHYANFEFVLVDLGRVSRAALSDVLEGAWRRLASQKMIREYTEGS